MTQLVSTLLLEGARRWPQRLALRLGDHDWSYDQLKFAALGFASALRRQALPRHGRVAIWADKRPEVVAALLGTSMAGGAFVPINPLLKPPQVEYILRDCEAYTLVTTAERLAHVSARLAQCRGLREVVLLPSASPRAIALDLPCHPWPEAPRDADLAAPTPSAIDADMAAILYTSGSTGQPKGVVLSHRNIVAGARSVAQYLALNEDDRLLAVLPLSFDYGLNQVTAALHAGASVVLLNHLFARDVISAVQRDCITGLAGVPALWTQLADLPWPDGVDAHLRYITNSGGHMPLPTLRALQARLPRTQPFLMYGLTEAFRSTYLAPEELARRPDSIGRAIPGAEILVLRPDGSPCDDDEPGELVHRGVHVALGYWNDVERTRARWRPAPGQPVELPLPEMAVWSGDSVRRDRDGYLYFIGRNDEMIKTAGYRVSPTEVEAVIAALAGVAEVAVFGAPHPRLGQVVVAIVRGDPALDAEAVLASCRQRLPSYMVPAQIEVRADELPCNANGKVDRALLARRYRLREGNSSMEIT
jgi:acyl-CoA ligase (AMP-forming) (exosortase A-associated)